MASGGIPRGVAQTGPAILSYGFRPFFLAAGLWAIAAMALWIAALTYGLAIGGSLGAVHWHAHEMVFGYTSAVLAGFMLTAIPNWTGRLPVSGPPLLVLVLIWLAGRLVFLVPDLLGAGVSLIVEAAFLPALALIALREIVAGRNWKNLKILGAILALAGADIWFHVHLAGGGVPAAPLRLAIGAWVVLIMLVGGRIIPSFTRNWLARQGSKNLPAAFGRLDQAAILMAAIGLLAWTVWPEGPVTAVLCAAAALIHAVRLVRWRGYACLAEPIVAVLHVAYLMLVAGLALVAASAMGWLGYEAAIHLMLIGAIGGMTLAVMSRAALGHTGRPIRASRLTVLAYILVFAAAIARPLVDLAPQHHMTMLAASGILWVLAFSAFTWVYAPVLLSPRVRASN
ncbi:NnrS family protein [Pelagibacterium lacus]|uniref:Short-chain dehydrogenase n=1 Tax=Pelagibacterium lacus TaxID=2282655 RepID=A0A369WA02_9HYPH|nr:NnrS family protein [Pelagibacterium lacus]RDE10102.1 short-chain dehydrogenase [Pelagibacterium lacus]